MPGKKTGNDWVVKMAFGTRSVLCKARMSASTSGMIVNHRALTGKLKRFNEGLRRLFELALVSPDRCPSLFESFTGDPLDRREIQTYSEWKVQTCFRNLNRRQKKRSKRRIIYILPVGPFPVALWKPVEGMEISMFELIANFLAIFFRGMSVKMMDQILISELNCKWRIHGVTGKLQVLVSGRQRCFFFCTNQSAIVCNSKHLIYVKLT